MSAYRGLDPRPSRSVRQLTERQRTVFDTIVSYTTATGELCPLAFVARRLGLHHSTVQEHVAALERKGVLRSGGSPASPILD